MSTKPIRGFFLRIKTRNEIPIFFATDDNYALYLAVAITSLLERASKDNFYYIRVLTTGLSGKWRTCIKDVSKHYSSYSKVEIVDLKEKLKELSRLFPTRDYYSKETYNRFFIPDLFPQYDKVLYLDCDIIFLHDVADLYKTELGDNLVAAAPEEVMTEVDTYGEYVEKALGVDRYEYFNAGVMLINARLFREERVVEKFLYLLSRFTFRVTQDEDYLNVICKGRTVLLDLGWNKTSFHNDKFDDKSLKAVHYKIHWKPWHYEGVEYEDYFWECAARAGVINDLIAILEGYTEEQKEVDRVAYERLLKMAKDDAADTSNYWNTVQKEGHASSFFRAALDMWHQIINAIGDFVLKLAA